MINTEVIIAKAKELGFDEIGFTDDFSPTHREYFLEWLKNCQNGDMAWLAKNQDLRLSPGEIMPGTRSAIVLATSYHHNVGQELPFKVARYAHGEDYHLWIKDRLEQLAFFIREEMAPHFMWRSFVDTGPLLERDLAAKAGIGWIGKNTCLINKDLGSYVFLSVILCNLDLHKPRFAKDLCVGCDLCIKACPTEALKPYKLDARRCLAYHNIEKRGERDRLFWPHLGENLVGCDICQEVCPRNIKVPLTRNEEWLAEDDPLCEEDIGSFLHMDNNEYSKRVKDSAISRIKYGDFMRNVFLVIAGLKRKDLLPAVLEWQQRHPELGLQELVYCVEELGS